MRDSFGHKNEGTETHVLDNPFLCANDIPIVEDVLRVVLLSLGLDLNLGYRLLDLSLSTDAHHYFVFKEDLGGRQARGEERDDVR